MNRDHVAAHKRIYVPNYGWLDWIDSNQYCNDLSFDGYEGDYEDETTGKVWDIVHHESGKYFYTDLSWTK